MESLAKVDNCGLMPAALSSDLVAAREENTEGAMPAVEDVKADLLYESTYLQKRQALLSHLMDGYIEAFVVTETVIDNKTKAPVGVRQALAPLAQKRPTVSSSSRPCDKGRKFPFSYSNIKIPCYTESTGK
ncbi:hypothetical protein E5288_WYG022480 [Bos mutus]|uniref:Uncharacterized protein n=1 Tax=Bos mutus TaxID=72004 RepID=A0A6B0RD16_9CETA|nr:hypothetical protein [Bos mutus]